MHRSQCLEAHPNVIWQRWRRTAGTLPPLSWFALFICVLYNSSGWQAHYLCLLAPNTVWQMWSFQKLCFHMCLLQMRAPSSEKGPEHSNFISRGQVFILTELLRIVEITTNRKKGLFFFFCPSHVVSIYPPPPTSRKMIVILNQPLLTITVF